MERWQVIRKTKLEPGHRSTIGDVLALCELLHIESPDARGYLLDSVFALDEAWLEWLGSKRRAAPLELGTSDAESEAGDRRERRTLGRA